MYAPETSRLETSWDSPLQAQARSAKAGWDVQLPSRSAEAARVVPRAVAATGARSDRRRDRRRLLSRRADARDRDTCRSGTPAPTCASTCSGDRSHDALPVQGRRELLDDPRRWQARREQGLGLSRGHARNARHHRPRGVLLGRGRALVQRRTGRSSSTHARPYHRVDLVPRSRSVRVSLDGVVLAGDRAGRWHCFETSLPTRWYIPKRRPGSRLRSHDAHHALPALQREQRVVLPEHRRQRRHRLGYEDRSMPAAACCSLVAFYDEVVDVDIDGSARSAQLFAVRAIRGTQGSRRCGAESGATHSDEHRTGDARGHSRAPYGHQSRELPACRPWGASRVIGDAAAERMALRARPFSRARRERPGGLHLRRHDERGRRRLDAAGCGSAAQPGAHAGPAGVLRRAAARARRAGIVLTRLTGMVEGATRACGPSWRAVAGMLGGRAAAHRPSQGNGGSGEILPLGHLFGGLLAHRR